MSGIFKKFASTIDQEQLKKEMAEAKENSSSFAEIPEGTYYVELEKIETKETQKHDPMVSIWFTITEGEFKKSKIFVNRVIQPQSQYKGFQMNKLVDFIESMDSGVVWEEKIDMGNLEEWLEEVQIAIEDGGLSFELELGKDKKGYDTHTILDTFQD